MTLFIIYFTRRKIDLKKFSRWEKKVNENILVFILLFFYISYHPNKGNWYIPFDI